LAERRKTEGAGETALQMLRFGLAEGHYLLPLAALSAVGPWQPVSSVPDGDPALLGLFSARSAVWAVFDLASLLGCDTVGAVEGGRILYLRGSARNSALRVDSLEGTAPVRAADIKQAPPDMRQQSECISGLLANGDIVIDADCLRNHPALKEEQEQ
jgi:chemotaxis signal transduction protein